MKTKLIAFLLGVVFAAGCINTIPVYAAEAQAQEEEPVNETAEEEESVNETDGDESVEESGEEQEEFLQPADEASMIETGEDAEDGRETSEESSIEASDEDQEEVPEEKQEIVFSDQTAGITEEGLIKETVVLEAAEAEAVQNGWYKNENYYGYWQYFVDGEPLKDQVKRIDGLLYGFNSSGYLITGDGYWFTLKNEDGRELYYCPHENGVLYENEWRQLYDGPEQFWYYFGEDGIGVNGLHKINGKLYAFTDGRMLTNITYSDETGTYRIGGNGVATLIEWVEGWNSIEGKWYYFEDGHFINNAVKKIGSNYYGFDKNGQMYQNGFFYTYGENIYEILDQYYAKSGGELLVNSWYKDDWDQWFYFGADGKGLNGLQTVGGKQYVFSDGCMRTDFLYIDGSGAYQTDGNGYAKKVSLNGWYEFSNIWYYFENGKAVVDEVRKIGSKYYLFTTEGYMLRSGPYYMYKEGTHEAENGIYRAKADGSLYVNEWYTEYDPNSLRPKFWCFYGDGGLGANGLKTINGKLYAFDKGSMLSGVYFDRTGIYDIDEDGVATRRETGLEGDHYDREIVYQDGEFYAFIDGELVKNEIRTLYGGYNFDGLFAFDENGRIYQDELIELFDEEMGKAYHYRAGYLGRLYSDEWFRDENGDRYYYKPDGKGADGLEYVDGKIYLFENGKMLNMLADETVTCNGSLYMIDSSGNAYRVKNGWNFVEGYRYYFEDNTMCTGLKKIDGSTYFFRESGAMCTGWKNIDNARYFFKGNGAMATGWLSSGGKWYYLNGEGIMQTGWQKIGSKWYFFDSNGVMQDKAGWQKVNNEWYYINSSGAMVTGWQKIGGIWYFFNETGAMVTGWQTVGNTKYYFNASGAMVTGWQKIDNVWYFFNSSGAMVTGWQKIGNVWYFFDGNGAMATGLQTIGNAKYYFDGSGAMRTGWQKINNVWYFFNSSGAMVTGWQKIGNVWYFFDGNGAMATGLQTIGNAKYYFDGSGAMRTGWQVINNDWYFFNGSGAMVISSWVGDYYLTDTGVMAVNTWIGQYFVGPDGRWIKGYNGRQ